MKLSIILLTLLLLPFSVTFGQAIDKAIVYGGLKYDDGAYVSASGVGFEVGRGLWSFASAGVANDGAELSTEVVYLFDKGAFSTGPILGPNVDWQDYPDDGVAPVAYLIGASGWVVAYGLGQDVGAWGFVKHRWTFEDNSYKPNTQVGLGLYLKVP